MSEIIAVLLKVAAIGILLLTIAAVIASPFIARAMLRELRKRQAEMNAFEADHKKRMAEMRSRMAP